jgi:hypothetical protein
VLKPDRQVILLNGVTTTTTGSTNDLAGLDNAERNFIANVAGTGAVAATVLVEVSNNGTHWMTLGTITLSGTTSAADGFVGDDTWQFVRGRVTAISGTSAAVTLTMGA